MRLRQHPARRAQRLRVWFSLAAGITLLLILAPVIAHAQTPTTVTLAWTAPGDDARIGTATLYEMRIAEFAISDANWSSANLVTGVPVPALAGTRQTTVVTGLTHGTRYWIGIKAVDDNSNWSPLSNVVEWNWVYDTLAPLAPAGLTLTRVDATSVRLRWTPNLEIDLAGYTIYRSLAADGPFEAINTGTITSTEYLDNTVPTGTDAVWYQVSASDDNGNESTRSSAVTVNLTASASEWTLEPGYPNPSKLNSSVVLPFIVPTTSSDAVVQIVDSGGRTVRRFDVSDPGPGTQSVTWDGRNQAGRVVAPGVYTAWLIAGDTRRSAKLVRVP